MIDHIEKAGFKIHCLKSRTPSHDPGIHDPMAVEQTEITGNESVAKIANY